MKYNPHPYQREAIRFMIANGAAGLFLDPGLGKTSTTLAAFHILKKKGLVRKMLVVAPLRPAYGVWPAEAAKWDEFRHLNVAVLHGPRKTELLKSDADVYVINPEGLEWLVPHLKALGIDMLVVDESTKFKHSNTKRFKILKSVLPGFRRRYILTGTPAPNGLLDLFGQIYILDLGNALGRYITTYRMNYFDASGYGGYSWVPRKGHDTCTKCSSEVLEGLAVKGKHDGCGGEVVHQKSSGEKIYEKLKPLVLRMSAEDYLDLEPYISNTIYVDLPDNARKVYDQMEDLLITSIESDVITAANAAVAGGKCRQIANGGLYTGDGEKWAPVHEAKADAVEELVEELSGKPVLIAYEYKHDLERLQKRFPDAPHIGGGVSPKEFRAIEVAWNDGLIPVLLAQPQSVAHGLNLQEVGSAVIWHSLTWNLEDYIQLIRRVWRQGQKERIVVHHIAARKTIDEVILKVVAQKDKNQGALLTALKSHLRGRRKAA